MKTTPKEHLYRKFLSGDRCSIGRGIQLHRRFIATLDHFRLFLLLAFLLDDDLRRFVLFIAEGIDVVLIVVIVEKNRIRVVRSTRCRLDVRLETSLKNTRRRWRSNEKSRRLRLPLNRFVFNRLISTKRKKERLLGKMKTIDRRRTETRVQNAAEGSKEKTKVSV